MRKLVVFGGEGRYCSSLKLAVYVVCYSKTELRKYCERLILLLAGLIHVINAVPEEIQ